MYTQNFNSNYHYSNPYQPPLPQLSTGYTTHHSKNYSLASNQPIFQSSQGSGFITPANYNEYLQSFASNFQGVQYDLPATQAAYQTQNIQGAPHATQPCQAQNNNQVSQGVGYVTQAAAAYPAQINTPAPQPAYEIPQAAYDAFSGAFQAFLATFPQATKQNGDIQAPTHKSYSNGNILDSNHPDNKDAQPVSTSNNLLTFSGLPSEDPQLFLVSL